MLPIVRELPFRIAPKRRNISENKFDGTRFLNDCAVTSSLTGSVCLSFSDLIDLRFAFSGVAPGFPYSRFGNRFEKAETQAVCVARFLLPAD